MSDSHVTLIGNATRDPELRFTNSGAPVANVGFAVSRRYQRNSQWEEETSFYDVICWGELGENLCASIKKGARLIVSGDIRVRTFDKQDQTKGTKVEITANDVGASIKWATVDVARTERKTAGNTATAPTAPPAPTTPTAAASPMSDEPF